MEVKWTVFTLLCLFALIFWIVRSENASPSPLRWCICLLLPLLIAGRGLRKKSLDFSGAALAVLFGFVLTAASACFCTSLLAFFLSSSRLTKFKAEEKRQFDAEYKEGKVRKCDLTTDLNFDKHSIFSGGQRNWIQVLCNGGVAATASVLYLGSAGMGERPLWLLMMEGEAEDRVQGPDLPALCSVACLASLACCCGDTWASEIGSVLSTSSPRLITSGRVVPRGTNGGVSVVGLLASLLGGVTVGTVYFATSAVFLEGLADHYRSEFTVALGIGCFSGLFGSLVDSLLGATLQYSGYSEQLGKVVNGPRPGVKHISGADILDNHTVNCLSSIITAGVTVLYFCNKNFY